MSWNIEEITQIVASVVHRLRGMHATSSYKFTTPDLNRGMN